MKPSRCVNGAIIERRRQTSFESWQTGEKDLTERQQRKLINNKHKRRLKGVI